MLEQSDFGKPVKSENDTEARLDRIETTLMQILEKMSSTEAMVEKVVAEVKPTIDELMQSKLFQMLNMGKKK